MRKPFQYLTAPLLGLILLGLVSSGFLGGFPPFVRFLVFMVATVFLPGYIIAAKFFRVSADGPLLGIPVYFLLGLSAVSVFTWIVTLLGSSFSIYLSLLQGVLFLFFAAAFIVERVRRRQTSRGAVFELGIGSMGSRVLYGVLAIALTLFFLFRGMPIDYKGDHYDHIGYIRTIALENEMVPQGVLAPVLGEEREKIKSDPRKGAIHPYLAAAAIFSELAPQDVWRYFPLFLGPVAVLIFLAFTAELLPPGGYRFVCFILFLLFYGGFGLDYLSRSAYGQNFSTVFFWMLFVASMTYARSKRISVIVLSMLLFLGGSLIHIGILPRYLLVLGGFVLFPKIFKFERAERLRLAAATVIVTTVVLVWKLTVSYQGGNVLHLHPQGLLYIGSRLFIVSPVEILSRYGLLFWGGIVIIPFLFLIRTHRKYANIHLALSVFPFFLCFNPFLTPVAYGKATYLVHRLVENFPAFQAAVLLIGGAIVWGRKGSVLRGTFVSLLVFVWVMFFLVRSVDAIKSAPLKISSKRSSANEEFEKVVSFFKKKAPRRSVVISDPVTSYRLSAFCEIKVVAVLHQHGNPNDIHGIDRLKSVRDVLSPYTTQEEALKAMEKYGASYVVLSGTFPRSAGEFLQSWDPSKLGKMRDKFDLLPEVFNKELETPHFIIYRRTGRTPEHFTWYPVNPHFYSGTESGSACEVGLWKNVLEVKKVEVEPKVALPGERIYLKVVYRKKENVGFYLPLNLYIRFDHETVLSRGRVYPGEKYVRRIKDRFSGWRTRFRVDHAPFEGMYAPDIWPIGSSVVDVVQIDLSSALRPGHYSIRLKLVEDTLLPNYFFSDFLFNEDSYSGPVCASIEIREFLTR